MFFFYNALEITQRCCNRKLDVKSDWFREVCAKSFCKTIFYCRNEGISFSSLQKWLKHLNTSLLPMKICFIWWRPRRLHLKNDIKRRQVLWTHNLTQVYQTNICKVAVNSLANQKHLPRYFQNNLQQQTFTSNMQSNIIRINFHTIILIVRHTFIRAIWSPKSATLHHAFLALCWCRHFMRLLSCVICCFANRS